VDLWLSWMLLSLRPVLGVTWINRPDVSIRGSVRNSVSIQIVAIYGVVHRLHCSPSICWSCLVTHLGAGGRLHLNVATRRWAITPSTESNTHPLRSLRNKLHHSATGSDQELGGLGEGGSVATCNLHPLGLLHLQRTIIPRQS
jgi:hypothetical protein